MRQIETAHLPPPTTFEPGPAPMLDWLPIAKLVIDDDYQRSLGAANWRAIRKIADAFSWSKFSPVLVAPIEGGLFAVIDGQHRAHAAQICGLEKVPCQITQMSKTEQARAFSAVNGDTIKVTAIQVFRAALMAEEPWAIDIRDCIQDAGCKVVTANKATMDKSPGEIYCVMVIGELIEAYGKAAITDVLRLMRRAERFAEVPENWAFGVLAPLARSLLTRPYAMQRDAWIVHFLDHLDVPALQEQAGREVRAIRLGGGTPPAKNDMLEALFGERIDKASGDKAAVVLRDEAAE